MPSCGACCARPMRSGIRTRDVSTVRSTIAAEHSFVEPVQHHCSRRPSSLDCRGAPVHQQIEIDRGLATAL